MLSQPVLSMAVIIVLSLFAWGCSAQKPTESPPGREARADATERPPAKPFLINEAKLPKDFPPPGPVDRVIVKDYPPYRLARVRAGANGVSTNAGSMFRPLFGHIQRNDIAMTAPVEVGYPRTPELPRLEQAPSATSMAFMYGDPTWGKLGTDEGDARIVVEDIPAMKVVSIGVRGDYTDSRFAKGIVRLNEWLETRRDSLRVVGPPRYLGYNSPFVLSFLRYGEVQLPVEEITAAAPTSASQPAG